MSDSFVPDAPSRAQFPPGLPQASSSAPAGQASVPAAASDVDAAASPAFPSAPAVRPVGVPVARVPRGDPARRRRWSAEERRAWLAGPHRNAWSAPLPREAGAHDEHPASGLPRRDGSRRPDDEIPPVGRHRDPRADRVEFRRRRASRASLPWPRAGFPAAAGDADGPPSHAGGVPGRRDPGTADDAGGVPGPGIAAVPWSPNDGPDDTRGGDGPTTGGAPEERATGESVPAAAVFGATAFDRPTGRLLDPGRRGLRALLVVAVIVLVVAAALAWRSRPSVEPVGGPPAAAVPVAEEPLAGDPPADGPAPSAEAEVVASVAGRVARPGLVRLPPGARVADAVAAAGGALPGTSTTYLNLARRVVDGELILVGVTPPPGSGGGLPAAGAAAGGPPRGGPVNLNTATVAELDALPGVGPVLAERLVAFRERSGGFRTVADLRKVDGIGGTRFERLKPLVTV